MPVALTYPGVYIEEIPSGVRTIVGVATSITAFVGRAKRGPVDEAVTINSYGDFERIFGGLWTESRLGFAVRDFYLNGGSQAIIVRVFHADDAVQTAVDAVADAARAALTADAVDAAIAAAAAADATTAANAADEGRPRTAAQALAGQIPALVAVDMTRDEATTNIDEAAAQAIAEGTLSAALLRLGTGEGNPPLVLEASSPGDWGNELRASVDHQRPDELPSSFKAFGLTLDDLFNLTLREGEQGQLEIFRNVTVKPGPRQLDNVLKSESLLARVFGALPENLPAVTEEPVTVAEDDQGNNGDALVQNDFTGEGKQAAKQGLYALEQASLFNLLVIPPYTGLENGTGGDIDEPLIDQAVAYCISRRAFMIIDPPSSWTDKARALQGFTNWGITKSNYAAVFFPRIKQANPLRDNQMEIFTPAGTLAGVFARTDTQRGVWKAPAGLDATLAGVPQLAVSLTNPENGELNPVGLNCLRAFPVAGRVVWGARTLRGADQLADEYKYIPVRRLALFLEESLYRGLQWVVFEPNDEPLWAQIRLNVGAFMQNLFRQGAFQGRSPREAYLVKCDKDTTTQNDINLGVVNVIVGFAPLKPAEFVVVKIQQLAGQIQV